MKRIIYDFGSNNGDDIPYYLLKSDLVVAVEANPILCELILKKFKSEIEQGKLIVESCVITAENNNLDKVSFYIHKEKHWMSQFPKPSIERIDSFEEVLISSRSVINIIKEYGEPYYIKIDIENYDSQVLKALFEHNYFPPFISAESHSIMVYSLLVAMGYNAFKLVEGNNVSKVYSDCTIKSGNEEIPYSFPHHSAGPFGNDINGNWMSANNFFRFLAFEGLGWKDIHATHLEKPDPLLKPSLKTYCKRAIKHKCLSYFKGLTRRF